LRHGFKHRVQALIFWGRFDVDDLILRSLKLFHSWSPSPQVLAIRPVYRQKMQNQTKLGVLLSIAVVFHNLTSGIKHNAHRAPMARTTLGRSASGAIASQ
jgi:hypothetical protein